VAGEEGASVQGASPSARAGASRRALLPAGLAILGLVFIAFPVPSPCPLRMLAGIPCATCGLTRAARLVLAGDVAGAFRIHPLWWLVLPSVGVLGAIELFGYVRTGELGLVSKRRGFKTFARVAVALVVAVWIARFFGAFGGPAPV
jgi:hypothetical protein